MLAVLIVAAVGVWCLVQGALVMAADYELPVIEGLEDMTQEMFDLIVSAVGVTMMVIGIITLILALLLFNGSRIGRTLIVIVLVLSILFSILSFVVGEPVGIFIFALSVLCLLLLYRPSVKAYFRR